MDGFTRRLFEGFFADPTKSEEQKQALADSIMDAYGPNPDPVKAEAVRNWCPMGDPEE